MRHMIHHTVTRQTKADEMKRIMYNARYGRKTVYTPSPLTRIMDAIETVWKMI